MVPYIQLLSIASTAFCLVAVAVDVYIMVVRASGPGQLHGGQSQLHGGRSRKAAISLLVVWLAAIVYSARIFIDLLSPTAGGDFDLDDSHDDDDDDDDETCILFIETDVDDLVGRGVDVGLLYVLPIAIQIYCYVKVARKLWSSQVRIFDQQTITF